MNIRLTGVLITVIFSVALVSCGLNTYTPPSNPGGNTSSNSWIYNGVSGTVVAGHNIGNEAALRAIPARYINEARTNLNIAYTHTSHGTHVAYGMFGLPYYKTGDGTLYGIQRNSDSDPSLLEFHDYYGTDLSAGEYTFVDTISNYLDNPDNSNINVVAWSWCDIAGHNVSNNYLPGMQTLIDMYGTNGSCIGTGPGKTREKPVTFIFFTGHANEGANTGEGNPRNQAQLIVDYCTNRGYFCLDYYSIDTHTPEGVYYEDTGDNGQSAAYGGNFLEDWQASNTCGISWYSNRNESGDFEVGAHNTQHITANRKAFAFWWILARIAGWDGVETE